MWGINDRKKLLIFFLLWTLNMGTNGQGLIVETTSGQLRGTTSRSRDGREVYEWRGIPYGKIPARFQSPVESDRWDGVRDATNYRPSCPVFLVHQFFTGHENCLFLNVYVPKNLPEGKRIPVMVFIHGGYFTTGAGDHVSPDYFMDFDVAFVTINYRLGPLGFLNTGDKNARGNMGLKDQSLALKWINKNIGRFGPIDPQRITLFGQSAGGASVHLQMLSPMSRGLMTKVIAMSGTALSPWAIYDDPIGQAETFAKSMNCPSSRNNTTKMVECLKRIPAEKLMQRAHAALSEPIHPKGVIFLPTIETIDDEETFLSVHPRELLEAGKFSKIPLMTGVTAEDGLVITADYLHNETLRQAMDKNWTQIAELTLLLSPERLKRADTIRDFYMGPGAKFNPFNETLFKRFTNLATDLVFLTGAMETADLHLKYSPVYLYRYEKKASFLLPLKQALGRQGSLSKFTQYALKILLKQLGFPPSSEDYGPNHADEIPMLFRLPLVFNIGPSNIQYEFSKSFVKLWVDFAYDETKMSFRNFDHFPLVDPNAPIKQYLAIDDDASFGEPSLSIQERLAFWKWIDNKSF